MQAFAPGKLVVLGEYAVLDGAPCLALAVRNGVVCNVSHAATRTIRTPDGDDRFVRAALDALPAPAATYAFRDAMPLDLPDKPGLGGSAAAVVAALVAGGCPPDRLLPLALEVHRAVQGSGSGIDVATSATGGAIRFEEGRVTPSSIPAPVVVYSGSSARTGPRVQAYRAWAARQPFVDASAALVDRFPSEPIATVREAWRLLCGMAEAAG
ncbi:MAG: hypothetical protein KC656_08350, partial [Myxococcales bacterium]|nr:hypothetical protein [Myxococcales bacterium]